MTWQKRTMNGKQGDSRRTLDGLLVSGCEAGGLGSVAGVVIEMVARSYRTMYNSRML